MNSRGIVIAGVRTAPWGIIAHVPAHWVWRLTEPVQRYSRQHHKRNKDIRGSTTVLFGAKFIRFRLKYLTLRKKFNKFYTEKIYTWSSHLYLLYRWYKHTNTRWRTRHFKLDSSVTLRSCWTLLTFVSTKDIACKMSVLLPAPLETVNGMASLVVWLF